MLHFLSQIDEAASYVRHRWQIAPQVGIVLGTGLGQLTAEISSAETMPYAEIPHFSQATALGHRGHLVCGTARGVPVMAMQGRFHLYEGYHPQQVTLPIRVMRALGIKTLIVSNASGGLNPDFKSGDLVILDDHINLMFRNPLIGINDDRLGPRIPNMCRPYDADLNELAVRNARANDYPVHVGVYAGVAGPNYETRAEYRMLRRLGADVVGMSTIPEVLAAVHAGMRVLALSAVTNLCRPDGLAETSGDAVIAAAQIAAPRLRQLVLAVLDALRTRTPAS